MLRKIPRRKYLKPLSAALAATALTAWANGAGWEVMHPGGGGQVQGISFDPNQDGKLFFNSDMEGTSISTDNGLSWENTGADKQKHLHQFITVVEPGNSNRVYNGGLYGLEISNNGGQTWSYVDFFRPTSDRGTVTSIAVNPNDVNKVYAGHGWNNRDDRLNKTTPQNSANGPRKVAYSHDRGATWQTATYKSGNGDKETYSIEVASNGDVYLAAEAGLFKSTNHGVNWTELADPSNTIGVCRGASLSPNGQYIYAAYQKSSGSNTTFGLFASKVSPISWTEITGNLSTGKSWWRPSIDPRDTGSSHHILMGGAFVGGSSRLWEANVTWNGSTPNAVTWTQIFEKTAGSNWNYDAGWRETEAKAMHRGYTPASWSQRRVWVSSDEGIYVGDPNANILTTWQPRYTEKTSDGGYITRGYESTFNWSVDGYGTFIAQGQADNAFVHSFNNGASWHRDYVAQTNDVGAIEVVPSSPYPVVVMGGVAGFGGGDLTGNDVGRLWVRRLQSDTSSWQNSWRKAGGDTSGINGMNHNGGQGSRVFSIVNDPFSVGRIYVGTQHGVYRHDNIVAVAGGTNSNFVRISGPVSNKSVKRLVADPNESGTLYVMQQDGTYRVENATSGSPTWTKINNTGRVGMAGGADIDAWDNNGTTHIAIGVGEYVYVSTNQGGNNATDGFTEILDRDDMLALHPPSLEPWFETGDTLSVGSIAGHGDSVFVALDSANIHGYAVLRGNFSGGFVTWEDWTNDNGTGKKMVFSRSRRAKVFESDGKVYHYVSTSGMGLWRRDISETGSGGGGAFGDPTNVVASSLSTTSATITWNAVTGAASYDIHKQLAGDVWRAVQNSYTGGTSIDATGLNSGGTYTFRVKARESGGQASGWTSSNTITLSGGSGGGGGGSGVFGDPENVNATSVDATTAQLTWDAVTDAASYDIHRKLDGDIWRAVQNGYTGTTSLDITGLNSGGTYSFRVKARKSSGQASGWTESNSVTLSSGGGGGGGGSGVFGDPENVSASSTNATTALITWDAVTDAVEYDVQRQLTGDSWRAVQNNYTGGTSISATGLTSGGTYKFRVKARKGSGQASGWTESNTITLN